MPRAARYRDLISTAVIRREPISLFERPTIVRGQHRKGFPMSRSLAQDKTQALLAATDDRLKREMSELQELREAVAEAERSNRDRQEVCDLGRDPMIF
jgi:hypothetical protein